MKKLFVVALCVLAGFTAGAQDKTGTVAGAEAAIVKYADATKVFDTKTMSQLMHPEALKRFRAVIDAALAGAKKDRAKAELLPLFSVRTVEAYVALSDLEAYKRLNDFIAKQSPELIAMLKDSTYDIAGSFMKEEVAYVTYILKITVEGKSVNSQVVQTLKEHHGKWLLLLPATAEATIAGIESRFK